MGVIIMAEIHKYLKAIGREVKRGHPPLTLTPAMKARMVRLYVVKGFSVRDVAAALKIRQEPSGWCLRPKV